MDTKEEIKKSAVSETVKTGIRLVCFLALLLGAALIPPIRDQIWPATPKLLLLVLLVISLSVNLLLFLSRSKLHRKLEQAEGKLRDLDAQFQPLKTNYGNVNKQLENADVKIRQLEAKVKKLSPDFEPDEIELNILKILADTNADPYDFTIAQLLRLPLERIKHHLETLEEERYISSHFVTMTRPEHYELEKKGRGYLIKKGLL